MRALVVAAGNPVRVALGDVADPAPGIHQAVVRVDAFSLAARDFKNAARFPVGFVPGFDCVGTVVQQAADGSSPPPGTRVLALDGGQGAWAQLRSVSAGEMATIPDELDAGDVSAMAIAGVTALRALRRMGSVLGKRVLITGAAGLVGWYGIQLAKLEGAFVVASVRGGRQREEVEPLAPDLLVDDLDAAKAPVDGVIEVVGGPTLTKAFSLVGEGGRLISVGCASEEPSQLPPYATVGKNRILEGFNAGGSFGQDLGVLLSLVASGRLRLKACWHGDWREIDKARADLSSGAIQGRAALAVA